MAQLIIPGAIQVAIRMECSGQEVVNVIGLDRNFVSDVGQAAQNVKTAWEATGGPLRLKPSLLKVISYRAVELNESGAVAEVASSASGSVGTSQLATMASSALVNIGAATRNRAQRGRLYHGPLTEGDINGDGRTVLPASVTALGNAYIQFRNQLDAAGTPWAVLSRKNLSFSRVTQVTVQPIIATQRRRQR